MTLGKVIAEARKKAGLSQKEMAARIKKEDGGSISPQYLNDIEHDRRKPSDWVIEQLARILDLEGDYLYHLAGQLPADLRETKAGQSEVVKAYKAFRRSLK